MIIYLSVNRFFEQILLTSSYIFTHATFEKNVCFYILILVSCNH